MCPSERQAKQVFARLCDACDQFMTGVPLDLAGIIPMDANVRASVMRQKPFALLYPQTEASQALMKLARAVAKWPVPRKPGGNIQFFWKSMLLRQQG